MKQSRVSRVRVEKLAQALDYRLVTHQNLGDRRDYWYSYSLVKDENGRHKETVIEDTTLKYIYEWLMSQI